MKHEWGQVRWEGAYCGMAVCARCGLYRRTIKTTLTSSGWGSVYYGADRRLIGERAPKCEPVQELLHGT